MVGGEHPFWGLPRGKMLHGTVSGGKSRKFASKYGYSPAPAI
jgi:hypothetical protein